MAKLVGKTEKQVRDARKKLKVDAVFKRIDTCAAEFEAQTPYMYSTYEAPMMGTVECEAEPSNLKKMIKFKTPPNSKERFNTNLKLRSLFPSNKVYKRNKKLSKVIENSRLLICT